ncbi:hypothetical protein SDC9_22251 [bioreactor metagenome]|jgi:Uncharacterized protein/domain associated with GTPases|uniref:DUF697 domain-containing protein n=1 Tax=bioreactor metagenome TaxID=1076179 RepID=A0A644UBN7_9ZZZZ|nr:hypothetical protein [Acidaminococcaceae bacterium]
MAERKMSGHQNDMCRGIIHSASVAAGAAAAGLAQIPLSDTAVITPIQITMVISLSQVFDVRLGEGAAKSLVTGFSASICGRAISQLLLGWIPGVGNFLNSATAAALTETIGWAAAEHFCGIYCEESNKNANVFDKVSAAYKDKIEDLEKRAQDLANQFEEIVKKKDSQIEEDSELINELKEKCKEAAIICALYEELRRNINDANDLARLEENCGKEITVMKDNALKIGKYRKMKNG